MQTDINFIESFFVLKWVTQISFEMLLPPPSCTMVRFFNAKLLINKCLICDICFQFLIYSKIDLVNASLNCVISLGNIKSSYQWDVFQCWSFNSFPLFITSSTFFISLKFDRVFIQTNIVNILHIDIKILIAVLWGAKNWLILNVTCSNPCFD